MGEETEVKEQEKKKAVNQNMFNVLSGSLPLLTIVIIALGLGKIVVYYQNFCRRG